MQRILLFIIGLSAACGASAQMAESVDRPVEPGQVLFEVTEVESLPINSAEQDFAPVILEDRLLFASSRIDKGRPELFDLRAAPFLHMYETDLLGEEQPSLLDGYDPRGPHEGPASVSPAREWFALGESVYVRDKRKASVRQSVRVYFQTGDGWKQEVTSRQLGLDANANTPFISRDGQVLFFSADGGPDHQGGFDIYVVERENNGKWGEVRNVGNHINSAGDEQFPFLHVDGSFYFSSQHNSLGGMDIFRCDGWAMAPPKRLNAPLNGPEDDVGFAANADYSCMMFSSNRTTGSGDFDLYRASWIEVMPNADPMAVLPVYEPAVIEIPAAASGVAHLQGTGMQEGLDGPQGLEFEVVEHADGAPSQPKAGEPEVVPAESPSGGAVGGMEVVREQEWSAASFGYDQVSPAFADAEMERAVQVLNLFPELNLTLIGHADSRGPEAYNQWLSERRATAVAGLIQQQVKAPERVTAEGKGETELLEDCQPCSAAQHARNRRVEFFWH